MYIAVNVVSDVDDNDNNDYDEYDSKLNRFPLLLHNSLYTVQCEIIIYRFAKSILTHDHACGLQFILHL